MIGSVARLPGVRTFSSDPGPLDEVVVKRMEYGKLTMGIYNYLKKQADDYAVVEDTIMKNSENPDELTRYLNRNRQHIQDTEAGQANYKRFVANIEKIEENKRMQRDPDCDKEMHDMLDDENENLLSRQKELETEFVADLLPSQKFDRKDCTVELRQAVGGKESALFAQWLSEMYSKFAERMGWTWENEKLVTDSLGKGVKNSSFHVHGTDAYRYFKYESGVHKYGFWFD